MKKKHQEAILVADDVFFDHVLTAKGGEFANGFVPIVGNDRYVEVIDQMIPFLSVRQRANLDAPHSKAPYRQLLPYVLLVNRNTVSGEFELFTYARKPGGGESRLYGDLSIGLGGHIEGSTDVKYDGNGCINPFHTFYANVLRELSEELLGYSNFGNGEGVIPIGFILDNKNDVGVHHAAIVYTIDVSSMPEDHKQQFACREKEMNSFGFLSLSALAGERHFQLEPWSKILVDTFKNSPSFYLNPVK